MADPMVSVIVPMYKVEQYIKICVDSILAQTFTDFEIILVDDASPDNCVEICQKLYGDNDKVRLIRHEKNLGLGPARNTGIKNARGKYVYFVDSDDYILPHALEKFFDAAERTNAEVVHAAGRYELVQKPEDPVGAGTMSLRWEDYAVEGFLKNHVPYRLENFWKRGRTRSNAWLCFCRRDFLQTRRIEFLPIISEDEPFHFALMCLAERYYILHTADYVHLLRSGSIMRSFETKRLRQGVEAMILGSIYVAKILDKISRFENYDLWRESILNEFFLRFSNNHTALFYNDPKLSAQISDAVDAALKKYFGNGTDFIKHFFNGSHVYRHQAEQLAAQNRRLNNIAANFVNEHDALSKIISAAKSAGKKIFLFGSPLHGNLGDQAIALGEMHVLKKFFPDREIVDVPINYLESQNLWALGFENFVRRDDIIFWHGGGNFGNLWLHNEQTRRMTIAKFAENKIIVFPQSICFTDDDAGRREIAISRKIYNAHKDLHIMTRDENSFGMAKKFFPAAKNYLLPDVVTVLQGILDDADVERQGVLFVLRRDKEKVRDDEKISRLQKFLTAKKIPFTVTDTNIDKQVSLDDREQKVREKLMQFRKSKLIVTDRFHGVIFSVITRTPVVAFKSFDTKISAGIRWFKNLPTVFYAEDKDLVAAENFIAAQISAVDEKNSTALAVKIDTDAAERFTRVLNQILTPPRLPESVYNNRRLTIDDVKISDRRISVKYSVQGDLKNFFNAGTEFAIEYSEDISRTPKDIAVIPFLCNVLPIAWVLDAEIVVDELDYDFHAHIDEIKRGYIKMYPRIKFGGKLTVGKFISHDYEVGDETAAFFSGGADSFDTLIAHAEEKPTLITLWGSDVKLTDREGWQRVNKHALETARQFDCKNLFVASTFRLFLREGSLSPLVQPLADDGWWHGFQHGIGIISHAAPFAYLHKLKTIYIASSFCAEHKNYTCASDPTIDNHVHIGKCVTVHDGYEFNRQEKLRRICEFKRRTGKPINLRVCWKSEGGENCCACEKCYRTICGILAEGENPADYGFAKYTVDTPKKIRDDFQKPNFRYRPLNWQMIQARFRERPENLPENLAWLMEMKF